MSTIKLLHVRQALGLSRAEVAQKAHVSEARLDLFEHGHLNALSTHEFDSVFDAIQSLNRRATFAKSDLIKESLPSYSERYIKEKEEANFRNPYRYSSWR
jgi:transcriptional regulator with XRE-family HTH domain